MDDPLDFGHRYRLRGGDRSADRLVRMLRLPVIDQLLVVYISLARATPLVTLVLFLFLSLPTMGLTWTKRGGDCGADAQYLGV
jgi:polar amino acid transport system permease protein